MYFMLRGNGDGLTYLGVIYLATKYEADMTYSARNLFATLAADRIGRKQYVSSSSKLSTNFELWQKSPSRVRITRLLKEEP